MFEGRGVPGRRPELELRVAGGPELQQPVLVAIVKLDACDGLRMAAVEAFGQPQQCREVTDDAALLARQIAEVFVAALGLGAAVIPRRQRDDVHLSLIHI